VLSLGGLLEAQKTHTVVVNVVSGWFEVVFPEGVEMGEEGLDVMSLEACVLLDG